MNRNSRLRTLVCGSRFGQFYLEALKALPEQFELVGLLVKGGKRSKKCAERYGIPLYTEVDQLPADIDLACVVLRSGLMGGIGTEFSLKLLERGILSNKCPFLRKRRRLLLKVWLVYANRK